ADQGLPRGDAQAGGHRALCGRHATRRVQRRASGAGAKVRTLANLRALHAVQRQQAVGLAIRGRAPGDLDRGTRPPRLGSTTGLIGMEPVLIAGAGPVGLLTALLLARWQVPTVVLEAAQAGAAAAGSRAIRFQRDVLDIFDRVGCADDMVSEGVTWTTGRTFYREHELFTVTFPDPGASVLPPWINLSQDRAERLLHAKASAEPLIDLRFGHQIVGVKADGGGVVVTARAGQRRADVGGSHLVGADGARSAVRQLLGIGFPGESYEDQFLICDIKASLPFPNERRFFFDPSWNPGRQVLVHQCPGGVWRIDWQVPSGFDLEFERATGVLDGRIRRITGGVP